MHIKSQIITLQSYNPGKPIDLIKRKYELDRVVKLSSNENPFGCSSKVSEALKSISDQFSIYPDGAAEALSRKVAEFLSVNPNQLLFGSGADEVIQILSRGLLESKHNIVQATPTFSQYEHHAIIEGAEVRNVPLKNGVHDLKAMFEQIDEQTKIVWICNPNNPTGTYVNQTDLESFLHSVPKSIFVVVDEAYVEYATADDFPDTISLLQKFDNLIILRTFSKVYGLASFRIGYGISSPELMDELNKIRLPFNTSMTAQVVAMAAIEDQTFIKHCVIENSNGLQLYVDFFEKYGIPFFHSQANFIYLEIENSKEINEYLESKGFIIRQFPNAIRITVGTHKDNDELINCIKDFLVKNK
ncbi:histidinol-phosphate transaminase [Bacillus sp. AFS001701]|uniref:histidinol-phosphate transaminase n=2 Tax=Bacillaceae TaxID=186817 RepID=UPI000BFA1180|nr:histidinol-phosphate transaminase [Bacillus sp. AFS001701]PET58427.1 histidinol-phosphate transaminase [Bacillus sp. AFS001701]